MPCIVARFGEKSAAHCDLIINGTLFCTVCPEASQIPATCKATCDPHRGRMAQCKAPECPCKKPYTRDRLTAFAKWLANYAETLCTQQDNL